MPGNFYISSDSFRDVIQALEMEGKTFDYSFTINHLSFGDKADFATIKQSFPTTDIQNPLDGFQVEAAYHELMVYKGDQLVKEQRPRPVSTSFFIDAIPSTFSSNLSWLFDTEVF